MCLTWLTTLFSTCLSRKKVPKLWNVQKLLLSLKPNKPANEPKSYKPMGLLFIPFKLFERLICNRIQDIVEKNFPHEQEGFRHGKSTVDQVALMKNDIENSFDEKKIVGTVFVDLSLVCDIVGHL